MSFIQKPIQPQINNTKDQSNWKTKALYTGAGLAALGGAGWGVRKFLKKPRFADATKQALTKTPQVAQPLPFKNEMDKYLDQDLPNYLDGFFTRKYILSLMSVKPDDIKKLKAKYPDIDSSQVRVPGLYSDRLGKYQGQMRDYLNTKMPHVKHEANLKDGFDIDHHTEKVKESLKNKHHTKILDELEKLIDPDDAPNLARLRASEAVAMVN